MSDVTIIAETRLEAVLRVKGKLGPEATIVSERRIPAPGLPGLLGKKVYEVVARVEEQESSPPTPEDSAPDVEEMRRELEELRETVSGLFEKSAVMLAAAPPNRSYEAWRALGVDPEEMGRYAQRMPTKEVLGELLPVCGDLVLQSGKQRVFALLGPSASGKTLTALKLAARFLGRAKVGLIGMDFRKPGGMEQLRAVSAMLGIPFQPVNTPDAADEALQKLDSCELVLVDTYAVRPGQGLPFEETRLALRRMGATAILVLSAGAKPKDALRYVDMTSAAEIGHVIYTQLDTTLDLSCLLTVGARWGLPIQFVCDGPGIEDIRLADAEELSEQVISSAVR